MSSINFSFIDIGWVKYKIYQRPIKHLCSKEDWDISLIQLLPNFKFTSIPIYFLIKKILY